MLKSQTHIAARSTPDQAPPCMIRTKTDWSNEYTPTYEDAMAAQMAKEARKANARMIGGGSWTRGDDKRREGVGKSKGYREQIMAYLEAQSGWSDRRAISEALGIPNDALQNALYSLTTSGKLVKRIVNGGAGSSGRKGEWRVSQKGKALAWEKAKAPPTNRQRVQLATAYEWRTTAQIAKLAGLPADKTYKALVSLASANVIEKGGDLAAAKWRKIGARRIAQEEASRQRVLDVLDGQSWLSTPRIAELTGFKKGKTASQLSRLFSLQQVERRAVFIGNHRTMEWRRAAQ